MIRPLALLIVAAALLCTQSAMRADSEPSPDNALANGDFHEWKNYQGGITTESVGTPPASLPTHWYGGPGVGAIATYDRIELTVDPKQQDSIGRWALRVSWSKPPSDAWPGEAHHAPAFRFTFLESFEIGDVRKFAGKSVRLSFYGRSPGGPVEIVPILWHSYDANTAGIQGIKGKGYELFESSGQWNQVAVAQGTPQAAARCTLGPDWQRFEKIIALPAVDGKSITPGHYTGVGLDLLAREAPTIELARIEAREARAASPAEHPDEEYYDSRLPKDSASIPIKPVAGESYEALVPDTLDLSYHAGEALNFLTRCIAPEAQDLCVFHLMHGQFNPCIFEIGHGSNQNQNAKWTESVLLMRAMTGSTWNTEGDQKLMSSLVRFTGPDGLFYVPVKNRPWAYIDPVTQKIGKPFADAFAEGRQLRALATWYQHDRNPMWKEIADRKVQRLKELAIRKDDTLYFKLARGYSPWYVETGEGPVAALGDVGQVFDSLSGDAAANMVCWMPQAAATWYQVTGNQVALELARGLARYLYKDAVFFDRQQNKFHNYGTFFTHAMNSLCSYALAADDREMIAWVKLGLDQFLEQNDADHTGMILMHACDYADMMQLMCMLSRTGNGDHWEDLDRWIRNGFDWRQITREDVDRMNNRPIMRMGDPHNTGTLTSMAYWVKGELPLNRNWPHLVQPDDANERTRGACGGAGCCQGNLTRAAYLCWDSILEMKGDRLKVNLLLNRASPWADVNSWIPLEGKATIQIKKPAEQVLVRVPRWVEREKIVGKVDGNVQRLNWAEPDYLDFGPMRGDETISLEFPIDGISQETRMKVAGGNRLGTLKIDTLALSQVVDDFSGAAGNLSAPGAGNNTGARGMTWRWNAGMTPPRLDGHGALELPVTGNWNQYIDTVTMSPFVLGGQDATFVAIFTKNGGGDVALGFVRDLTWDRGDRPQGQRLFKIKDNKICISNLYESDKTDEETGVSIKPDAPQGLMIKKDAQGNVSWYYQDGGQRDPASPAWKNITPAASKGGNLDAFHIDLGHIGVNSLGEGTKKSIVTMKGNTVVAISENIQGYPIDKHAKYRQPKAVMKKVRRFSTSERFIWY